MIFNITTFLIYHNNEKFYYKYEKNYDLIEFKLIYSFYDYISLKEPRFMFRYRNEFAKRNSFKIFQREYNNLNLKEKFYITYAIIQPNIIKAYKEFIYESNFKNIFKKESIIGKCLKRKYKNLRNKNSNKTPNEDPMAPIGKLKIERNFKILLSMKIEYDYYFYRLFSKGNKIENLNIYKIYEFLFINYKKLKNASNKNEIFINIITRKNNDKKMLLYKLKIIKELKIMNHRIIRRKYIKENYYQYYLDLYSSLYKLYNDLKMKNLNKIEIDINYENYVCVYDQIISENPKFINLGFNYADIIDEERMILNEYNKNLFF